MDAEEWSLSQLQGRLAEIRDHLEGRSELKDGKFAEGHYTNTARGGVSEIYYRTLADEYPQTGVIVKEDAIDRFGAPLTDYVAIYLAPEKRASSAPRVHKLLDHPVARVLGTGITFDDERIVQGETLEKVGILAPGTTAKSLARSYEEQIKLWGDSFLAEKYRQGLELLNTTPISDAEIKQILVEKVLTPELGPPKQTSR